MSNDFKIGILGGTGLEIAFEPEMIGAERIEVDTVFGKPSDSILVGKFGGIDICMLPRHRVVWIKIKCQNLWWPKMQIFDR